MGLFTTNAPAAKFAKPGDSVEGEIIDVYQGQRYEFVRNGSGQPMFWNNKQPTPGARMNGDTGKKNDPVLDWVITVDTGVADENGETERRIFFKTFRMEKSLKKAVRDAKAREGLLLGGHLKVTYTGDDEKSDAPTLPKMFDVVYTAPAPGEGREPSGEIRLAGGEQDDAEVTPWGGATQLKNAGDRGKETLVGHMYTPSDEQTWEKKAAVEVAKSYVEAKKDHDDTPPF